LFLARHAAFAQTPAQEKHSPGSAQDSASPKASDADEALQKAIDRSGNDRAALERNLKQYLLQYPDAPQRAAVYRALVEACKQLRDSACALEYAERLVALRPDDYEMMMLAVALLQQQNDDASLARAVGYITRVLDRIEKSSPEDRTPRESLTDWQQQHDDIRASLYSMRGAVEKSQHNPSAATKDLEMSYSLAPNAVSAKMLGEIAEEMHDPSKAIDEYTLAFVLPQPGPFGKVDRRDVRMSLGNVWRQVHGSEAGLGDQILAAYDKVAAPAAKSGRVQPK